MRFRLLFASLLLCWAVGDVAHASGPVERLVQVLLHPSDPNVIVVRWGVASDGYLYSRDGGKTFAALCSTAITPNAAAGSKLRRLSGREIPSTAATLIDASGHVLVTQIDGLWSDDATGCSWSKDPVLDGYWPYALVLDPRQSGELLAVVNKQSSTGTDRESRARLMRRDASGAWSNFEQSGELVPHVAQQQAYGTDLIAVATGAGEKLYANVAVSIGLSPTQEIRIVSSTDGGKTWSAGFSVPIEQVDGFALLAVDPKAPNRLLAAQHRANAADSLLLSEDEGKTFAEYAQLREITSATFAPDGRVYIGDVGDGSAGENASGGIYTAAQLGQPLTKIDNTATVDCLTWSPSKNALYVCQSYRVRLFDPAQGSYQEVLNINTVPALLSCPKLDVAMACQEQLNMGPSWCCTGHYPCSPFCSMYDITEHNGQRVFCGVSGLQNDLDVGRTCESLTGTDAGVADAGARDAGARDASAPTRDAGSQLDAGKVTDNKPGKSDGGCALGARRSRENLGEGALLGLGLLLAVLGRSSRQRTAPKRGES
jgi:BNR/Asp-box repeat